MSNVVSQSCFAIIGEFENLPAIVRRQGYFVILQRVNDFFKESFLDELILTEDNKVVGLLKSAENLMKIVLMIKNEFYPLQVRFGIGVSNQLGTYDIVYDLAENALVEIETLRHKKESALLDVMLRLHDVDAVQESSLNTIMKLLYLLEQNWTDKQRRLIHLMIFENMTQVTIAQELNVSASNVQQMLKNGNYFAYRDTIDTVENLLNRIFHEAV